MLDEHHTLRSSLCNGSILVGASCSIFVFGITSMYHTVQCSTHPSLYSYI